MFCYVCVSETAGSVRWNRKPEGTSETVAHVYCGSWWVCIMHFSPFTGFIYHQFSLEAKVSVVFTVGGKFFSEWESHTICHVTQSEASSTSFYYQILQWSIAKETVQYYIVVFRIVLLICHECLFWIVPIACHFMNLYLLYFHCLMSVSILVVGPKHFHWIPPAWLQIVFLFFWFGVRSECMDMFKDFEIATNTHSFVCLVCRSVSIVHSEYTWQ